MNQREMNMLLWHALRQLVTDGDLAEIALDEQLDLLTIIDRDGAKFAINPVRLST